MHSLIQCTNGFFYPILASGSRRIPWIMCSATMVKSQIWLLNVGLLPIILWGVNWDFIIPFPIHQRHLIIIEALRIREEIKRYSRVNSGKWLGYYSLELAYGNHSFDRTDSLLPIQHHRIRSRAYTKTYHVSKEFYGLLVQRGFVRQYKSGFMLRTLLWIRSALQPSKEQFVRRRARSPILWRFHLTF
jgi:hypothetical protein